MINTTRFLHHCFGLLILHICGLLVVVAQANCIPPDREPAFCTKLANDPDLKQFSQLDPDQLPQEETNLCYGNAINPQAAAQHVLYLKASVKNLCDQWHAYTAMSIQHCQVRKALPSGSDKEVALLATQAANFARIHVRSKAADMNNLLEQAEHINAGIANNAPHANCPNAMSIAHFYQVTAKACDNVMNYQLQWLNLRNWQMAKVAKKYGHNIGDPMMCSKQHVCSFTPKNQYERECPLPPGY